MKTHALMLAAVLLAACPSQEVQSEIVGEWYGEGPEFSDDALCLVFCDNGRYFAGDSPCSETDRSDFEAWRSYERLGDVVIVDAPSDCAMECEYEDDCPDCEDLEIEIQSLEGDRLAVSFRGGGTLPLERVSDESPLCTADLPAW